MSEEGRIDGEASLEDLSPEMFLSDYLIGIEPQVNGKPVEREFYKRWLARSVAHIEKEANISIKTRRVLKEPHDYNAVDYQNFSFIQLWNRPILDVQAIRAVFPTGQLLMDFPKEWLRVDHNSSQVQLVPTQGSLSSVLLGRGGAWLPLLFQTLSYLPQFFQVDYTTGFPAGKLPEDIIEAVMKRCAIDVLAQFGDLIYGPGVTSVSNSMDGMSESRSIVNNGQLGAVFTSRIAQYRKDLYGEGQTYGGSGQNGLIKRIKQYYGGVIAMSL